MNFEFMTNEDLRDVLHQDHSEMLSCFETRAWKAVHVLAGSIVEAVLVDYLLEEQHEKEEVLFKKNLHEIIELSKNMNMLSNRTLDLCSVIKGYRNLVHPGRSVRTEDQVDEHTAQVALSLVEIIAGEISELRRSAHGYTAEQIISKLQDDSSVKSILEDLLEELRESEKLRLVFNLIPSRYMEQDAEFGIEHELSHEPELLKLSFRIIFRSLDKPTKTELMDKFIQILKEKDRNYISNYEQAFFQSSDLEYLSASDATLVKKRIFSNLGSTVLTNNAAEVLSGIGKHLNVADVDPFIDPLVKAACIRGSSHVISIVHKIIRSEIFQVSQEVEQCVTKRLDAWAQLFQENGNTEADDQIKAMKSIWIIPF